MREILKLKKDLEFNSNIAEISSISLECVYSLEENKIKGNFLVDGTFRSHEISLNKSEYGFKIPFEYKYNTAIEENTAMVNVKDFTYTIDSNILSIDIEYEVFADEIENETSFLEKEEFDRFLEDHEVEIVDLYDNKELEKEVIEVSEEEKVDALEIESELFDNKNIEIDYIVEESDDRNLTDSIINNIASEESYITYHVYICTENDSLDSIANRFKITIEQIKNYNMIDDINVGMKLIIPSDE